MKNTVARWTLIAFLTVIAAVLQVSAQSPDAQRKEINPQSGGPPPVPGLPVQVPPDAQRKEIPFIQPITVLVDWLSGILPAAQRKE